MAEFALRAEIESIKVHCWSFHKEITNESLCRGWCSGPCFRQVATFAWLDTKEDNYFGESPTYTCVKGKLWWCWMRWVVMSPSRKMTNLVTSACLIGRHSSPFRRQSYLLENKERKVLKQWYESSWQQMGKQASLFESPEAMTTRITSVWFI